MLRKSLLGITMMAVISAGAAGAAGVVYAGTDTAVPTANGALRNQTALAIAGRITPQMRAMAGQCAGVIGAARSSCIAAGSSAFADDGGKVAVAILAFGGAGLGGYEAFRSRGSNPPTPAPIST